MPSYQCWTRQLSRRQGVSKAGTKVWDSTCSLCKESHKKKNLHNHNVYTEDLAQIHADFLLIGLVSASSCEPWLVDSPCFMWENAWNIKLIFGHRLQKEETNIWISVVIFGSVLHFRIGKVFNFQDRNKYQMKMGIYLQGMESVWLGLMLYLVCL